MREVTINSALDHLTNVKGADLYTTIDHGKRAPGLVGLTFRQRFTRFCMRVLCCASPDDVMDYEYDCSVVNTLRANLDIDVTLKDVITDMGISQSTIDAQNAIDAKFTELPDVQRFAQPSNEIWVGEVLCTPNPIGSELPISCDLSCRLQCSLASAAASRAGRSNEVVLEYKNTQRANNNKLKRRTYRRRKRCLPFVVIAVVNHIRAKHPVLEDTSANRRMLGYWLRKVLKENNMRDTDVAQYADLSVDLYFLTCGEKVARFARM